jgi:proteasome lid subunit RPN8/RPN11
MQTLFRELSASEIDLVAGGETIYITGRRVTYGYGGWGGGDGYDTEPRYDDPPPTPPPPVSECELDAAKDTAAQTIAAEIKAKADWTSREYGALVLRDASGYIWFGELNAGETVAEALARATAAGSPDYAPQISFGSVPAGYTVVGVVHSHPDIGYNAAEDAQNKYPSADDYSNFAALVGTDSRFSTVAQFTHYIVGPDGVLREYDLSEGVVTPLNDTKAATRADLASDRPCS